MIDGSAPAARMAADAAVPALGDPVKGTFGPQVGWPIMPIHAVLLPDGRVMSYGTEPDGSQTAIFRYDVWDPRAGTEPNAHVLLPNTTQTDIFCSSQIVLLNGDVAMFGGDNLPTSSNTYNDHVNLFHPASNTIERAAVPNDRMNRLRWYSSATVLPNAEVYIQGGSGGADLPERRNSNGSFTLLTGAPTNTLSSGYPKNWVAPNGLVFGIANNQMYEVNPAGNGTIRMIATASRPNTGGTSTAVMFEPGKILQVGGGTRQPRRQPHRHQPITPQLTPVVTPLPQLQYQTPVGQRHGDGRRSSVCVRRQRGQQRGDWSRLYLGDLQSRRRGLVEHRSHGDPDAPVPLHVAAAAGRHRHHDGWRHTRPGDQPQCRDLLPAVSVQR